MQSGKWIDDTEGDDDKAFAAEQEQHGKPAAAPPAPSDAVDPGSAAAAMAGPAPAAAAPVAPPAPLSAIEKAKLLQFVQSNAGNPVAVAAARQMLLRDQGGNGGAPPAAPAPPPMPPSTAPPVAAQPPRQIQVGDDGLVRPMPGPSTMADKAKLVQTMRNRAMLAQAGVR